MNLNSQFMGDRYHREECRLLDNIKTHRCLQKGDFGSFLVANRLRYSSSHSRLANKLSHGAADVAVVD